MTVRGAVYCRSVLFFKVIAYLQVSLSTLVSMGVARAYCRISRINT